MTIDHLTINKGRSGRVHRLQAAQLLQPDRPSIIMKGLLKIKLGTPDAKNLSMDISNNLGRETIARSRRNHTMELEAHRELTDAAQGSRPKVSKATARPENVLSTKVVLHTERTGMRLIRSEITKLTNGNEAATKEVLNDTSITRITQR
eukprot:2842950-Amphidinium_carterae.1